MIRRIRWLTEIRAALRRSRVTALIGPRQSGKTTLAREIVPPESPAYFDLEDPRSLARLAEPMTALGLRREQATTTMRASGASSDRISHKT